MRKPRVLLGQLVKPPEFRTLTYKYRLYIQYVYGITTARYPANSYTVPEDVQGTQ
jgi:hypothetical protein